MDEGSAETQPIQASRSLVGATIDGFLIEDVIGTGAFGTVYRARQLGLDRVIALKVPTHEIATDPVMARRFAREARSAARVSHPGVVTIHQVGELPDGRPYLAMQFVEGESLDKILQTGPLPVARALVIARQVASALTETHAADVVHRDLKPSNIIWRRDRNGDDRVTLVDFGIAICRQGSADASRLTSNGLIGTPHYMSPEQCQGEQIDHRADIYALGCVLFELLTCVPPFAGSGFEVLLAHMGKPAPTPVDLRADIPADVAALVGKLLEKRPEDRPQTAADVVAMIDALDGSASSPRVERVERARRKTAATTRVSGVVPTHRAPTSSGLEARRAPSWRVGALVAVLALSAAGFAAFQLVRTPNTAAAIGGIDDDEPEDTPTGPVVPRGADRRQIVDDDGEFTMRVLIPDPVRAREPVRFHIEIWNKLGTPIDAAEIVVTIEDPHATAAGLSARAHGVKDKRHFGFRHRFPEAGQYHVKIFPPGSSSTFAFDVEAI